MECRQGEVVATYKTLVALFGEPKAGEDKIDAVWVVHFENGDYATIYNWKNGENYLGGDGLPVSEITTWNIGGTHKRVAEYVNELVRAHPDE